MRIDWPDWIGSGSATLVEGANILHLLAASTAAPGVEGVLWPLLLEFLLQPEYTAAVAAISKALTMVAGRRVAAEGGGLAVAYQNLQVSSVADPMKFWYGSGSADPYLWLNGSGFGAGSGCGSGSYYFRQWPSRHQQKIIFCLLLFEGTYIYIIFQR